MYAIEYSKQARKTLKGMPTNIRILILSKIEELAADPFSANNVKKLEGRDGYRLRVGNWRVIYEVNGNSIVLYVVAIGARGGVYQ